MSQEEWLKENWKRDLQFNLAKEYCKWKGLKIPPFKLC